MVDGGDDEEEFDDFNTEPVESDAEKGEKLISTCKRGDVDETRALLLGKLKHLWLPYADFFSPTGAVQKHTQLGLVES
jgi:hypothetical protein